MKGKMTNQAKNADCSHQTHLFRLPRSSRDPFDETVVTINSVSLTIISTSSAIVTGCERSISIPSAIKAVNNSIFSATETIISVLQIRISNRKATISELIVVIDGL